jgi:acyl-CoA synthetase (AMP-forming)/AMP-acid ligase II
MRADRSLVEAIWGLADADKSRGLWFIEGGRSASDLRERQLPFVDLVRLSAERGTALLERGLAPGDRAVLVIPDLQDFVITFVGAILAGIVPVPIYPPLGMGNLEQWLDGVEGVVTRTEAKLVVTVPKVEALLGRVQRRCPSLTAVVTPDELRASGAALSERATQPDEVAFLQFTSGSTSRPKGVRVTHGNLTANIAAIQRRFALRPDDVTVSWLPLYHDMGLIGFLLVPLWVGMSGRLMPPQDFLRRPLAWLEVMHRHRGTVSVVPNFAYALCARRLQATPPKDLDLTRWRIAGCGAEPILPSDLEAFASALAPSGFRREAFLPLYGLAEATLAITIPPLMRGLACVEVDGERLTREREVAAPSSSSEAQRLVACGTVLPDHRLEIFDPDDEESARPLPERTVGEVRIVGPSVTRSYWNDPEASARAFAGDHLRTGDLGFLDGGELYLCGRLKELIIVNGRNYFPGDIERAAAEARGVRRGGVMAFQTPAQASRAPRVVLAVELTAVDAFDESDLRRRVMSASGLVLDEVVTLAPGQLPKTSSGKAQRLEACRLYQRGELSSRPSSRQSRPLAVARHLVGSQLAYAAHYVSSALFALGRRETVSTHSQRDEHSSKEA